MTVIRSYSQFRRFGECPHRWSLERKYEPRRKGLALDEGAAFHLALGKFYAAKSLPAGQDVIQTCFGEITPRDEEDAERLKTKKNALTAVVEAYWTHVAVRDHDEFDVLSGEQPFEFETGGVKVVGQMDGVWRHKKTGTVFLVEHKYMDDLRDELMALDLQVSLYTLALLPQYGLLPTLYNVCRKPLYKETKKDGTPDAFRARVREMVAKEAGGFSYTAVGGFESRFLVRRAYSRGKADLEAALQQIKAQSRVMAEVEADPSRAWRNIGDQCLYWCPFRDICVFQDPILVEEFFTVKARRDAKRPGPAGPAVRV